ncbi:MAG: S41 family peptidase [Proteobacteria bacterium]|nr:S41 family peptidase [Pseudomonadota bacterium]
MMSIVLSRSVSCMVVGLCLFYSHSAYALKCGDLTKITKAFNKNHIYEKRYDDKISQRTFEMFLQRLDPLKMYFLASDIENFKNNQYDTLLDDQSREKKCDIIDAIIEVYKARKTSHLREMRRFIDQKHDFSVDEELLSNARHYDYASSLNTLRQRRRKRIKFAHMGYLDNYDDKDIRLKLKTRYDIKEKRFLKETRTKLYGLYLNAFANSLDNNSRYSSPLKKKEFDSMMRRSLHGIGVQITEEEGITKIVAVIAGGPASKQGELRSEDKVLGVAQNTKDFVDVVGMELNEVVNLIRGERGTTVRLLILRKEASGTRKLQVKIVRDKIEQKDQLAKGHIYHLNDLKRGQDLSIGVIDIPGFYRDFSGHQDGVEGARSVSRDVGVELVKLMQQGIDALILDLRDNSGGSLDESVLLPEYFMPSATILQRKSEKDKKAVMMDTDNDQILYDGTLVVLTNIHSASASEIVAGAIKDHDRGIIVGDKRTFGKGTVQNIINLERHMGSATVTTQKYYTPNGHSTQLKGVASDVVLHSHWDVSDPEDYHGEYPVPWEQVPSAKLLNLGQRDAGVIASVNALSKERRLLDGYFINLERTMLRLAELRKRRGNPVSLRHEQPLVAGEQEKDTSSASKKEEHIRLENKAASLDIDYILKEALSVTADYHYLLHNQSPGTYQPINHAVDEDSERFISGCLFPLASSFLGC